ncbi:MAG: HEAT repeat domain-containing protein [bacterium]|nr:HEAT repeat domain-containing protein [bacterium]
MIRFACEHCDEPMAVPDSLAGQKERCPFCNKTSTVPSPKVSSEPSWDDLAKQLHHPEIKVRCQAAAELGESNSPKAVELLVNAFRDSNKFVREQVSESLRQIGDPSAVGMLVRDIGGHWVSAALVHEAVREIVKFGPIAGPPLIEILTEINQNPRKYEPEAIRAAVMVLGLLGEQEALSLIAKMFRRHFDIHVRDEAAYALVMIDRPEQWKDISELPEDRRRSPSREQAKKVIQENRILV